MIYTKQKDLSERIIEHLMLKEEMQDDLEGIVVGIYNKEMEKLSERITKSLSDLITKGKITIIKIHNGKRIYQLTKKHI